MFEIPEKPPALTNPDATVGQIIDAQSEWHRALDDAAREHLEAAKEIVAVQFRGDRAYAAQILEHWLYEERATDRPEPTRKPISAKLRREVFEADAYRCVECDSYEHLQVDHIHPVSRGGTNDRENLQTLCRTCNIRKKDKVPEAVV